MNLAIGQPPRYLIQTQRNDKYLFRLAVVSQWLWAEIACWKTKLGGDRSWTLSLNRAKMTSPWISLGMGIWITG